MAAPAAKQRSSRLSTTDVAALGWVGVCCYLYNGEHAQIACLLASVVPPAAFSYLLIIDQKTTHEGMRSLLFFWFLQGMLLVLDTLMGNEKGFYFGKFLVLSGMFWKAVKDNNYGYGRVEKVSAAAGVRISSADWDAAVSMQRENEVFDEDWPTESTQGPRSYRTRPLDGADDEEEEDDTATVVHEAVRLSAAKSAALPTVFTATERDFDEMSAYTCSSFRPAVFQTPVAALQAKCSAPFSSARAPVDRNPLPGLDLRDMDASPRFPYGKLNEDYSLGDAGCGPSDSQSIMIGRGDLRTDPAGFIVIPGPHAKVHLRVQNTTEQAAMFGLKCNAMERIKATPTAGVIAPGETISIRLCLNDNVNWPSLMGERWDKLAIDYHLCSPTVAQFDRPTFFGEQSAKFRVKFNVIYRTDAGPVHGY